MTTETKVLSKGQKQAADVSALLRSRQPLLWIVTREEARVEGFLAEAAKNAGYPEVRVWDVAQGVQGLDGKKDQNFTDPDAGATLTAIRARAEKGKERGVWIMRDLPVWIGGGISGASTLRALRNLARLLPGVPRERAQAIIVLSPDNEVPKELQGHATVIEWPLPDRSEVAAILDGAINALPEFENGADGQPDKSKPFRSIVAPNGVRESAIDAAVGLSGEEAASCFARSLVQSRKIDPTIVSNEKKRVIARERVLEWYDPIEGGLDAVGGLENLKTWLIARKDAYSPKARAYGLPSPKGAMLVGISGCGKSLTAKAVSTAWEVPLIRFDLGAMKSKFVGDSERTIRKAFAVIEAIGRCVVWFDEIEKSLQGATSGSADGGVSSDALGAVLTWMNERKGDAFIIATANDVSGLPPEFLRKGRFDEIFWIDTPNADERKAVLKTALKANGRAKVKINLDVVGDACKEFTGAEIAAIVPDALFAAFADNAREINTADLLAAAKTVVPLTKTAEVKIKAMRDWAKGKARPATREVEENSGSGVRVLDID